MIRFRKANHPDSLPKTRSYMCIADLCTEPEVGKPEVIGSFLVLGNPGYYILRTTMRMYEQPAHFMSVEIDKLTEQDVNFVVSTRRDNYEHN